MKLLLSKDHNPNYTALVATVTSVEKHPNADKLSIIKVAGTNLITALDMKVGDEVVYFPTDSKLCTRFLSETNSYRKPELNSDPEVTPGFFEHTSRVKSIKLRGEYSDGHCVPLVNFLGWINEPATQRMIDTSFDTIFHDDGTEELFIEKYISKEEQRQLDYENRDRKGRTPKLNRIIPGTVLFHNDTENLRRNINFINPETVINISYKGHGTSAWFSNIPVKRKLNFMERVKKFLRMKVQEKEYDLVYGTRRTVKNKDFNDPKSSNFYSSDVWEETKDKLENIIPRNYCLYGEIVGFTSKGQYIQKKL